MPALERIEARLSGNYPTADVLRSRTDEEIQNIRIFLESRMSPENRKRLGVILGEPIDEENRQFLIEEEPAVSLEEIYDEVIGRYGFEGLERSVADLYCFSGLTDAQIAKRLNLPLEEVVAIKSRAVGKMRRYHTPGV